MYDGFFLNSLCTFIPFYMALNNMVNINWF